MEAMQSVLGQLSAIFIILLTGFILRKKGMLGEEATEGLFMLVTKVGLSSAVIVNLQNTQYSADTFHALVVVFAGNIICMMIAVLLSGFVCRLFRVPYPDKGVWIISSTASNIGFMGIPVISSIYGPTSLFLIAASLFASNLFVFSILNHILSLKEEPQHTKKTLPELLKPLQNVVLYATLLAFILYLFSVHLPYPLLQTLQMFSGLTTPLAMLAVGATLASQNIRAIIVEPHIYIVSLIKLIITPLAGYYCLAPFIKDPLLLGVIVLGIAMPTGNAIPGMALDAKSNVKLASGFVLMTTLFSLLTIPIIVWVVL